MSIQHKAIGGKTESGIEFFDVNGEIRAYRHGVHLKTLVFSHQQGYDRDRALIWGALAIGREEHAAKVKRHLMAMVDA